MKMASIFFFRGLQTTTVVTRGFSRSYNQAFETTCKGRHLDSKNHKVRPRFLSLSFASFSLGSVVAAPR